MNLLDFIILGLITFFLIKGIFGGFFREISSLAGIISGLLIGNYYHHQMANLLRDYMPLERSLSLISFVILFILVFMFFNLIGVLLHSIFKRLSIGWFGRVGIGLALVKGIIISCLLILLLTFFIPSKSSIIARSKAAHLVTVTYQSMTRLISLDLYGIWKKKISKEIDEIRAIELLPDKRGYSVLENEIPFFRRGVLGIPEDLAQFDPQYSGCKTYAKTRPFVVFADRDNISFYRDEACTEKIYEKSSSLMDPFFVRGVSANRKALYLVDAKLERKLKDSRILRRFGWAKVDELLLIDECRKAEDENIAQKAIIIKGSTDISPGLVNIYRKSGRAKLYAAPNDNSEVVEEIRSEVFGYIYKEISCGDNTKWYLMGNRKSFYGLGMSNNEVNNGTYIFGWVKNDRATPWDTREALEPVAERKKPAHIYDNLPNLINNNEEGILFYDRMKTKKWPMGRFRYPIRSFFKRGYMGQDYAMACIAFFGHNRTFSLGYVAIEDKHHRPIMRKVLLFNRNDFSHIITVLDDLLAPQGRDLAGIKKVWMNSIIKTVGGDKHTRINECIRKRLGILFPDRHKILSKSIDELEQSDYNEISAMLDDCDKIREKLCVIRSSNGYWFKNLGQQYTWLSQEFVP